MGLFEVIGIASIVPFMQLVAQPDVIQENNWLSWIYEWFGFQEERSFLFVVGAAVLGLLALSNTISAFTQWFQYTVVWSSAHALSERLLKNYMYQPYEFFLDKNSAELGKQILSEVASLANKVLTPIVQFVAERPSTI